MRETEALGTTPEVAAYIKKPPATLAQWRYLGVGPKYLKLNGRDVRYRWADVEKWLDEQAQAAA
jgi:predicted DNA-binding transcriptional regulator AlpA